MSTDQLPDAEAVRWAIAHSDQLGQYTFGKRYGSGNSSRQFVEHEGRLYAADGLIVAAHTHQYSSLEPNPGQSFHGTTGPAVLQSLGFQLRDGQPSTVEEERAWRLSILRNLQARADRNGLLQAGDVRAVHAFDNYRGIWVDKERTGSLHPAGVTIGLMHTGIHYPDEIDDDSALYQYPRTRRPGQDRSEIAASKAAAELALPVFVVSQRGDLRSVRLGWVADWDDRLERFLVSFGSTPPAKILDQELLDDRPFELEGNRRRRRTGTVTTRPDQARFKLEVFKRYGAVCPLSGLAVYAMLEAAHLRPDAANGSSDPRNGIVLNAALHRALDAHLFAIHPETLEVMTTPSGPTIAALGIKAPHLDRRGRLPHQEALRWRYESWLKANRLTPTEAVPPTAAA
ncbi:HNH endonuclease signature motif containing protein [Kitasatospora sp. NPDC002040]|uniref:HNH endonuclease signature motif containing protein n=1 Tax=Kitasatospora sp. NPDC002040 TaxID=3154661 RepID=UPI00333106C6